MMIQPEFFIFLFFDFNLATSEKGPPTFIVLNYNHKINQNSSLFLLTLNHKLMLDTLLI